MKTHQDGIKNAVTISQVVPTVRHPSELTIEPHAGRDRQPCTLRTVGRISQAVEPAMTQLGQNRLPQVRRQQQGLLQTVDSLGFIHRDARNADLLVQTP